MSTTAGRQGCPRTLRPTKRFCGPSATWSTEPGDFQVSTSGVDTEISAQAGPQLVVPLLNARFATNAANARWGSLYDALYGTDVIPEDQGRERGSSYNPLRGAEVIARARAFLDEHLPLAGASHADATSYAVDAEGLAVTVKDQACRLADPSGVRRLPRGRCHARRRLSWSTTGCTWRSRSIVSTRSAPRTRPGSRTSCWRRRSPRSWTSRTRSRPSTPRTRSSATATGCS